VKDIRRLINLALFMLAVAAVVDQLRRPSSERTWEGQVLGVPYDFRPPTGKRLKERWWNPEDPRLLTPHVFGVGWSINLYQAKQRLLGAADADA
jgi:hypothetical protein